MKPLWQRYIAWYGGLIPRERILVMVAVMALAGFVSFTVVLEPVVREYRRLTSHVEKQASTLESIKTGVAALAASNVDPDQVNRERVNALTRQLRGLDDVMRSSQKGLVPAGQMAKVLSGLLDRRGGLKIVALRTLPATPLLERGAATSGAVTSAGGVAAPAAGASAQSVPASATGPSAASAAGPGAGIFKHGVELVLQGSYAELSAYLEQIERLPAQMFWARAVLDAEAYPQVTLTLSIFTIGMEAAWLSV